MQRRQFLGLGAPAALYVLGSGCTRAATAAHAPDEEGLVPALAHLEPSAARLGVAIFDTQTGQVWGHRLDERFRMCSTFKLTLAAWVLHLADRRELDLEERVPYSAADLVPHAPVTERHLAEGQMRVVDLARAAQCQSDNVAANLLLRKLGGPQAYTRYCRSLGDTVTRLDRNEPELNGGAPSDERDTTTPRAAAQLTARLLGAQNLSAAAQQTLRHWMLETETGLKRIRAGLPAGWQVGDKTGTSTQNCNDVACVWFTQRAPLIITAYLDLQAPDGVGEAEQLVLARVGTIAAQWAQQHGLV